MRSKLKTLLLLPLLLWAGTQAARAQPKPSPSQLAWQDMEFYLFMHFGPNTFTDKEWGQGDEPEDIFNPRELDCRQWCRVARAAGAKGIIITAKHHDGFCLWPSRYSRHTVRESKWKNGKGDVLKELSAACREYGLKFGVYISPWDRNHPDYGTPAYNEVFVNMMKELFTNYGPIRELWWDGANGEGPNGKKQVYDWPLFRATVKKLSPNTVIFSDVGPHIRWVGNENGEAGETNWNTLDTEGFTPGLGAPPQDTLTTGNRNGKHWIPAEADVSIRPGWFYHKEEDDKVKTPELLFGIYLKSVGRGAALLLNVPPDRSGRIHANDSASLVGFRKLREQSFGQRLAKKGKGFFISHKEKRPVRVLDDGNPSSFVTVTRLQPQPLGIEFGKPQTFNCIVLQENLAEGQSCARFRIRLTNKKELVREISGTTIGRKRIICFPATAADAVTLSMEEQKGPVRISEIGVFRVDERLMEKKN